MLEFHRAVHENMIDAANEFAVFNGSIDDLKAARVRNNKGMSARHTTIIEHDAILFGPADSKGRPEIKVRGPAMAGWFCDGK